MKKFKKRNGMMVMSSEAVIDPDIQSMVSRRLALIVMEGHFTAKVISLSLISTTMLEASLESTANGFDVLTCSTSCYMYIISDWLVSPQGFLSSS